MANSLIDRETTDWRLGLRFETGTRRGTGTKTVSGRGKGAGTITGCGTASGTASLLTANFPVLQPRLLLVANKGILNYTSSWISRLIKCTEPHKQSSDPIPLPFPLLRARSRFPFLIAIR